MAVRVRRGKIDRQRGADVRPSNRLGRRRILRGVLLTAALPVMFAAQSIPSEAATTAKMPGVSPVTVKVPGGTPTPAPVSPSAGTNPTATIAPPAITTPTAPVKTAPAANPSTSSTPPSPSTQRPANAPAPAGSEASSQASSSTVASGLARSAGASAAGGADAAQPRLRSVVVSLSQCLSVLSPGRQRLLLLRAGIGMTLPDSRSAVARTFEISVAREGRVEHTALVALQTAARERRCGSPPVWVHVPPADRLVLVDSVLANPALSAGSTGAARHPRTRATDGKAKPSFTLGPAKFPLLSF